MDEIVDKQTKIPRLIQNMINSGAKAKTITRLISSISDAILDKLVGFALQEFRPAPAPFVFLIVGSEGRNNQTLKTNQDNAIIYADVSKPESRAAKEYFLKFGELVCTWLGQAGYDFCKGDIMAKNPKWCQPLSIWKQYFYSWIRVSTPKDLMQSNIFFDLRGDAEISNWLTNWDCSCLNPWRAGRDFSGILPSMPWISRHPWGFSGILRCNPKASTAISLTSKNP